MSYRAALIGCGAIGSRLSDDPLRRGSIATHAEAYSHCPQTELVAVCDIEKSRLEQCGSTWGVAARYTDFAKMIQEQAPEIVSICTPDETHAAILRSLLADGNGIRAIWCEKPFTTDLAAAKRLHASLAEKGTLLAVNYSRRYMRNLRRLKHLLQQGELGAVQAVSGWYTKGVLHNGSHWFDLLRWLVGDVTRVQAFDQLHEGGDDPTLDVRLVLPNGILATLRAADQRRFTIFEMDLLTTGGRVLLTEGASRVQLFRSQPSARFTGYSELEPVTLDLNSEDARPPNLVALEDLLSALGNGHSPACGAEDGIAALQIAAAALQSSREGREIAIVH